MKSQRGVLLFEVAFVVLLVSVISLFLFRGYGIFSKAGRKSLAYIRLVLLSQEKAWDFELLEKKGEITLRTQTSGDFEAPFSWQMKLEDTGRDNFKKGTLKISSSARGDYLDTVMYLNTEYE